MQSSYEEGLATAEGDPVTETTGTNTLESQLRPQLCHPTDGELRDGVDCVHKSNIHKSDSKRKRMFLSAKNDDDVVRLITTAAERDAQEQIERLQRELQQYEAENHVLQAELKRTSLLEDKQMRGENLFQLSRECAAGVASRVEKDLPGGAGPLPGASKLSLIRNTLSQCYTKIKTVSVAFIGFAVTNRFHCSVEPVDTSSNQAPHVSRHFFLVTIM